MSEGPASMHRLYRLALHLLPRGFRDEFGTEMEAALRARWSDRRAGLGVLGAMRFWARESWAVVWLGGRLWVQVLVERKGRRGAMTTGFRHDVRQAGRALRRRPGFALLTLATLGLGIGAATAVFSAVHAVLLRPLPYPEAERALVVFHRDTDTGNRGRGLSPANARDLAERSEQLAAVAVAEPWGADLLLDGRAESLRGWRVSEGFFEALGTSARLGRLFVEEEYLPGGDPVVVLGYESWSNRFGADPALVGGTVRLDTLAVTVVGVLPPDFEMPAEAEFWTPRPPEPYDERSRSADFMTGIARLATGAELESARTELEAVAAELRGFHPETNTTLTFDLLPLREHLLGDVRTPLLVLFAAVGFVLLIACSNVAGLLLARGVRRKREYALRRALGATTARLARQLTVESATLATLGCAFGIAIAWLGVHVIRDLGVQHLPRVDELRVDGVVLAFAVAAAALSALVAGIVPVFELSRLGRPGALAEAGRGATPGSASLRSGRRLVVAEVAVALVLVVGAGLLAKSLATILDRDLGFSSENRLAVQAFAYDVPGGVEPFVRSVRERMEAIPGVRRVAVTSSVPGATDGVVASIDIDLPFTIEDRPAPPVGQEPTASITQVSDDFFEVMGMRIVDGRGFDAFDREDAPAVVVVNETLARGHFGEEGAVGETLVIGYQPVPREIVGVVADVRRRGHASDAGPEVYFPLAQFPTASLTFVLETEIDARTIAVPAREAVWEVRPEQAVWATATVDELLGTWLTERRFNLLLLGGFAAVALALAAIGVYGLVSFNVEQRLAELGVRRVLGGEGGDILALVMGEALRLAGAGILIGTALALALTRAMRGMLYGIEPTDPVTFVAVGALTLAVAAVASLVPALRAVRQDPMSVLRGE